MRSWWEKISSKSCAAQCTRVVDKMVQLYLYGSLWRMLLAMLLLRWYKIWYTVISFWLPSLAYLHKGIILTLQKTSLHYCSCSWGVNWDVHSSHFFVLSVLVNAEKLLLSSNKTNNAASNNLIKFFKAVAKLSKYMPGI